MRINHKGEIDDIFHFSWLLIVKSQLFQSKLDKLWNFHQKKNIIFMKVAKLHFIFFLIHSELY